MKTYSVNWQIDIDAETPQAAALLARQYQLDPDTPATHFDVIEFDPDNMREHGNITHIDVANLNAEEEDNN